MDEIFQSRLVRKPAARSRLTRVAEPPITWQFDGVDRTVDEYLRRTRTTAS
jgi:hypothetical protein